MKYILFGGSGFIGSKIKARIQMQAGSECFAPKSSECDLRNPEQVANVLAPILKNRMVIFAAGIPRLRADGFDTFTINQAMIFNLLAQFERTPPNQLIFLSTVEVYGTPDKLPIMETTPLLPDTLYGVGKVTVELMLQRWQRQTQIPLAILRLPGIYGPEDQGKGLIGALIRTIRNNGEFNLIGGGKELRDFVFVDDVAQAVLNLSAGNFKSLTLNLATGTSYPVSEIIQKIFKVHGECKLNEVPQTQKICHLQFDISMLRKHIPKQKMTILDDGIRKYEIGRSVNK